MGLGKVLYRSVGNIITNQKKIMDMPVPQGTKTFDYLSASGKKGNFQVVTFRDENGASLAKNITSYENGQKIQKTVEHSAPKSSGITTYFPDGSYNVKIRSNTLMPNGKEIMIKNEVSSTGVDRHSTILLEQGKKAKGITYTTKWDGKKPELEYINTDKRFNDTKNLEYYPLICEFIDPFRINKRIRHISKIQEKQLKLEGITPKPKIVPHEKNQPASMAVTDIFNGQIKIYSDHPMDSLNLLNTLGHEYRHAKDFFNMERIKMNTPMSKEESLARLEQLEKLYPGTKDFMAKADAKGFFKDKSQLDRKYRKLLNEVSEALRTPEYFTNVEKHRSYGFEQRAEASGKAEVNKLSDIAMRLQTFILGL